MQQGQFCLNRYIFMKFSEELGFTLGSETQTYLFQTITALQCCTVLYITYRYLELLSTVR